MWCGTVCICVFVISNTLWLGTKLSFDPRKTVFNSRGTPHEPHGIWNHWKHCLIIFFLTNESENIKFPYYWPFVRWVTGGIPLTKGQLNEEHFCSMTSSWTWEDYIRFPHLCYPPIHYLVQCLFDLLHTAYTLFHIVYYCSPVQVGSIVCLDAVV